MIRGNLLYIPLSYRCTFSVVLSKAWPGSLELGSPLKILFMECPCKGLAQVAKIRKKLSFSLLTPLSSSPLWILWLRMKNEFSLDSIRRCPKHTTWFDKKIYFCYYLNNEIYITISTFTSVITVSGAGLSKQC